MKHQITIEYEEYSSVDELEAPMRELMQAAVDTTAGSYSPYSHFSVGAALRLGDGTIVCGSNQENIAYPSGLCAERTAIFAASAQRPDMRRYEAMAIVGRNADGVLCEASPCGACRQVLSEYEHRQGSPMKVLCYLGDGRVRVFGSVADLLPLAFEF